VPSLNRGLRLARHVPTAILRASSARRAALLRIGPCRPKSGGRARARAAAAHEIDVVAPEAQQRKGDDDAEDPDGEDDVVVDEEVLQALPVAQALRLPLRVEEVGLVEPVDVDVQVVREHRVQVCGVEAEASVEEEEGAEVAVVALGDALVEPRAVVVKLGDALVADDTVLGARRPRDHTRAANLRLVDDAIERHLREAMQARGGDGPRVGERREDEQD
jgi:hypothetical protein